MLHAFGLAVRVVALFLMASSFVGLILIPLWMVLSAVGLVGPVNVWIMPLSAIGGAVLLAYGYRVARAHGADPWGPSSPGGDIS